jgi:hypothetical protein
MLLHLRATIRMFITQPDNVCVCVSNRFCLLYNSHSLQVDNDAEIAKRIQTELDAEERVCATIGVGHPSLQH